jgi:MFS family permease
VQSERILLCGWERIVSRAETTTASSPPLAIWGRLAANSAAHMTEHLFSGVIAVILPLITASLGLSLAQAGALASARTLFAGLASFPSGFFADLARRRSILLGLCIGMIGRCSRTERLDDFSALLLMALAGFGGGWFIRSLGDLVGEIPRAKAFVLGVHDSSANLGEVVGPLAIGLLLSFFDWRTALQIWAVPGILIGLLYALFGAEGGLAVPRARDYGKAVWNDVLRNKVIFALVVVSTLRSMGQTALAAFLPLFLSLHLKFSAGVTGAYMSVLFLFAGLAPAAVGWISDRFGHKRMIVTFSLLSVVAIGAIPYLGSGLMLGIGMGALGALLWALRPVIVSAAMSSAPQNLSGSIVAFIYGANMSVSFLAPILAGLVADAYGLPAALNAIAFFPLVAAAVTSMLLNPPRPMKT